MSESLSKQLGEVTYDIKNHKGEGRVLTAEFKDFSVVCTYTPNSGALLEKLDYRVNSWDKDFFDHLRDLEIKTKKPVVIAGDLNVICDQVDQWDSMELRLAKPGSTLVERDSFKAKMKAYGLIDTFRHLYPEKVLYSAWDYRGFMRS